jgi:predicted cobalt transporter CbtA
MSHQRIAVHLPPGTRLQDITNTVSGELAQDEAWIGALIYSFTGTALFASTCKLVNASISNINSLTGNIGNIQTQFINCTTGYVDNLSSNIGNIGILYTNTSLPITGYVGGYMVVNSVTGSSVFFSAFSGSDVYTSSLIDAPSVTGTSAFFSTITGTNAYASSHSSINSSFSNMNIGLGHFSLLLADNFTFPTSIIVQNFNVTDTLTGVNIFSNDMTGQNFYYNTITGTSAFFSTVNGPSLKYESQLSLQDYTGSSAYFTTITGTNMYSTLLQTSSLTGSNIYVSSQVTSLEVTGTSIYSNQSIAPIITGSNIFISSSIQTPSLETDTITSYISGQPVSVAGVEFNNSNVLPLCRLVTTQPLATRAVTSWTSSSAASSRAWKAVCWSPELGLLCSVSTITGGGDQVQISSNGTTWTTETSIANDQTWYDVCYSSEKNLFVACGGGGLPLTQFMYSSNGTNWSGTSLGSIGNVETICYAPELGLFCGLCANSNASVVSSNGISWVTYSFPSTLTYPRICWSPELGIFCCLFGGSSGSGISSDGQTWTTGNSPNMNDLCWAASLNLFCAVSTGGEVAISSDGMNWTISYSVGFSMNGEKIAWSPELGVLVTIGNTGGNGSIGYSLDGVNWTSISTPNNIVCSGLTWSRELGIFSAVSNGETIISRYVKKCY